MSESNGSQKISRTVTTQIKAHLMANQGRPVKVEELAAVVGKPVATVQKSMNIIAEDPDWEVFIAARGRLWNVRYIPDAEPEAAKVASEPRMFEEIGFTRDGKLIIKDEDRRLWVAEEM